MIIHYPCKNSLFLAEILACIAKYYWLGVGANI